MIEEVGDFKTDPVQARDPQTIGTHVTALAALTRNDLQTAEVDFARWSKEGFATCISSIEEVMGLRFKRSVGSALPEKGFRTELIHHSVTVCVWDTWAAEALAQAKLVFSQTFHRAARHWYHDVKLVGALEPSVREAASGIFTFSWKQRVESSTEVAFRPSGRAEEEVRG